MNQSGQSQFNQARIEWAIRLRYSPMPKLDPSYMASQLNAFRIGELRVVGKTWEIMMERSAELAVNADKRYSDLAGLQYQIVSDGSPDGDSHAEALTYFYKHLRVTAALDQDKFGGVSQLLSDMATAHSYYYSAHEMLMRVDNAAAREVTAEFRHTPVWFFESRRGYLAYLPQIFDMYGQPCVQGEWLTCVGLGWMRPLCMAYCTEMFTMRDWQVWCLRYASGFLEGIVDEAPGSTGWTDAQQALETMANDGAVLHSSKVILKFLEQSARTGMPFSELVQLVHGLYAKCYRGVDLATSSRGGGSGTGSGGSQNPVGASVQKEESGIFLVRDAVWATGYLNDRVDTPVIRYLFNQEPRAGIAVMPPLDDTTAEDLASAQALVPLGLRISLSEAYKRFRWTAPNAGEPCLTPPVQSSPGGEDQGDGENPGGQQQQPSAPSAPLREEGPDPESEASTQPAQEDQDTPIAAGAKPGAMQTSDRNMPDPQVQAGSMMSQAAIAVNRARKLYAGSPKSEPALAYAIPNELNPDEPRDSDGKWTEESKGTGSAAFKEWFGASKVVGDDGKPLRVFHGTSADIAAFDRSKISKKMNDIKGFYFSSRSSMADIWAGDAPGANVIPAYVRIEHPATIKDVEKLAQGGVKTADLHTALKKQGFDGVYDKQSGLVIALDPKQIKSAIGNKGTWSRKTAELANDSNAPAQPTEEFQSKARTSVAAAIREDLAHAAAQIGALMQIDDPEHFKSKAAQLSANWEKITGNTLLAPSAVEPIMQLVGTSYANGLAAPKPAKAGGKSV